MSYLRNSCNLLASGVAMALVTVPAALAQQSGDASAPPMSAPSSSAAAADSKFLKEAADGGMAEVALGQLAADKASSADVKQFGQRMVEDHGKANDELKQLAMQKHVDLPAEPSAKHKATKARLEKLSGDQFDKAYMADMLMDHKKDVAAFQRESNSAKDPDVKSFAAATLPTLKKHLKMAQSLAGSK
jgi:putative membrane protein